MIGTNSHCLSKQKKWHVTGSKFPKNHGCSRKIIHEDVRINTKSKNSLIYLMTDLTCYISLLVAPSLHTFPVSKLDTPFSTQSREKIKIKKKWERERNSWPWVSKTTDNTAMYYSMINQYIELVSGYSAVWQSLNFTTTKQHHT